MRTLKVNMNLYRRIGRYRKNGGTIGVDCMSNNYHMQLFRCNTTKSPLAAASSSSAAAAPSLSSSSSSAAASSSAKPAQVTITTNKEPVGTSTSSIRGLMSALSNKGNTTTNTLNNSNKSSSISGSNNDNKGGGAINTTSRLFSSRLTSTPSATAAGEITKQGSTSSSSTSSSSTSSSTSSSSSSASLSSLLSMSKSINSSKMKTSSSSSNRDESISDNATKKKFSFNLSPTANLLDVLISKRANNQHNSDSNAANRPLSPSRDAYGSQASRPSLSRERSTENNNNNNSSSSSSSRKNNIFVMGEKSDRDMAEKITGQRKDNNNKAKLHGYTFNNDTLQAATAIQDALGTGSIADEIDSDNDDDDDDEGGTLTAGEIRYRQHQQHLQRKKKGFLRKYDIDNDIKEYESQPIEQTVVNDDEMPYDSGYIANYEAMDISDIKKKMEIQLKLKKQEQERKNAAQIIKMKKANNNNNNNNVKQLKSTVKEVVIPADGLELRQLASSLSMKVTDLIAKLEELGELDGVMRETSNNNRSDTKDNNMKKEKKKSKNKINKISLRDSDGSKLEEKRIDADVIELIVLEMGISPKRVSSRSLQSQLDRLSIAPSASSHIDQSSLTERSPVVCIMGHVDHGKTTLLDTLRKANVADSEAGGITQKLSAFRVTMNDRRVVFLDTPGHAAFNTMRANGAAATDLVVLVIDANDGVRPQTKEAIQMAKSSNCSIIIALNKIDKIPIDERKAARSRVLGEVNQCGLVAEDYGGDALVVEVAGKTGEGVDTLIESLLLQADIMELKACNEGYCEATVLDSYREKERGVVCDMLVGWGELNVGDDIVVGTAYGRVRAMYDDTGKSIESAGPSTPVRVIGLRDVPSAGQELISVQDEDKAKEIADRRLRYKEMKDQKILQSINANEKALLLANSTLDENGNLVMPLKPLNQIINIILKADCAGTIEALENVVKGVSDRVNEVEVKIMGRSIGDVTPTDIERATTIGGETAIFCFNTGISDFSTRALSKEHDVKIFTDTVIYRLEEELINQIQKKLPTEKILTLEGSAKVLQVFNLKDKSNTTVGGLNVISGTLRHNGDKYIYKIKRGGSYTTPENGLNVNVLKRFKDTVHEVQHGNECGLVLDHWKDFEVGDEVECYKIEYLQKKLVMSEFKNS